MYTAEKKPVSHPRQIRSFVRREGRLTPLQTRALDTLWPHYGIAYTGQPLDLDACFGRQAPRVLEIGFGNGEALLKYAVNFPDTDFLGIEVYRPGIGRLLHALEHQHIDNVRILCHDAVEVLEQCIPDASLHAIHLFFPDPWPKLRHHKRRIVQSEFAHKMARVLISGGIFHAATDWQHYARHIQAVMLQHPDFHGLETRPVESIAPALRPLTRFEQRGKRLNHTIHDLLYRRGVRRKDILNPV